LERYISIYYVNLFYRIVSYYLNDKSPENNIVHNECPTVRLKRAITFSELTATVMNSVAWVDCKRKGWLWRPGPNFSCRHV